MEEKKKLKFTVLDLIIVLFIVACIVGAVVKSGVIKSLTKKDDYVTLVYTVKFEDKSGYFVKDVFKTDTVVYDKNSGAEIGTVTEIRSEKTYYELADENGVLAKYEKPNSVTAYVTIAGQGLADDYGYYASGSTVVCPGATVELATLLGTVSATVIDVNAAGEK